MEHDQDSQNTIELQRCPECGYSLYSLPATGRCPECGTDYDASMIVLYGCGDGQRASLGNASRGRMIWIMIWTPLAFVYMVAQWFPNSSRRGFNLGPGTIAVVAMLIIWVWTLMKRRESIQIHGAPSSLRLSPDGYEQRDGSQRIAGGPWNEKCELILKHKSGDRYRIQVYEHRYRWWWIDEPAADFQASLSPAVVGAITEEVGKWCRVKQSRTR